MKVLKQVLSTVLLIFFTYSAFPQASSQQWLNYSKDFWIKDIDIEGDFVWVSSWGGLARIDKTNGTVTIFDPCNSGLTQGNVNCLVIDNDGTKWIGTQYGGLVSFDGTTWTSHHVVGPADTIAMVFDLAKSASGDIWISAVSSHVGTSNGSKLFRYDGSAFTSFPFPVPGNNSIYSITCDSLNNVWAATYAGLFRFDGTTWTQFTTVNSAIPGNPSDVDADSNNNIWMAINIAGGPFLCKFDGVNFISYQVTGVTGQIQRMNIDYNNHIWLYGGTGMVEFDGNNFIPVTGLPFPAISTSKMDSTGKQYIGFWTSADTIFYERDVTSGTVNGIFTSNSHLDGLYGRCMDIDDNNVRWSHLFGGLNRFDGITYTNYTVNNSGLFTDQIIDAIFADQQNNIWIGGASDTANGNIPLGRFDGVNWNYYGLPGLYPAGGGRVFDITEDLTGNIWIASMAGIAKYDGTTWTYYSSVLPTATHIIYELAVDHNNTIWAMTNMEGILRYDGISWTVFNTSNSGLLNANCGDITIDLNNSLWVTNELGLQKFDGNTWSTYPNSITGATYVIFGLEYNEIDNTLWLSTLNEVVKYDGNTWQRFDVFNSGISSGVYDIVIDKYNNKWMITLNSGLVVYNENGIGYNTVFNLPDTRIEGAVFYDQNSDGVWDSLPDHGVSARKIFSQTDSTFTFTATDGNYVFLRDSGNYLISYLPDTNWFMTTDSVSYQVLMDSTGVDSLNFGTIFNGIEDQAMISSVALSNRCEVNSMHIINYRNTGTTILSGQIRYIKNSLLDFVSSNPAPVSVSGDTIIWDYINLLHFEERQISLLVNNPGVQLPGVILESYVALLKNQSSIAADTVFQEIICSFDPNDKQVIPAGQGPAKEVLGTDNLYYTIRFQNTGNDTAFFVMLIDTISAVLDMNTFEFIGSSHSVSLSCSMSGVVQFRFENINLLWSSINEPASHGFVRYRIKPKTNLQLPVVVTNKAFIYFDFNPAIITNEVWNTIVNSFTGSADILDSPQYLKIYPNPSGNSFSILVPDITEKYSMTLYDFTGKIILTEKDVSSGEKFIIPDHSSGIYNVVLKNEKGMQFHQKLVIIKN